MGNTAKEKQEHEYRAMRIVNELASEYANWYGWTEAQFGRYVALGEYILEETSNREFPHDNWLEVAREAFLKWKETHNIPTAPPHWLKA